MSLKHSQRSTRFVFTWNNFPSVELEFDPAIVRYARWQHEDAGTPHLQGYVSLRGKETTVRGAVKRLGWSSVHMEHAVGDLPSQLAYISKDVPLPKRKNHPEWDGLTKEQTGEWRAGPWEFGAASSVGQGKRCDLSLAAAMILEDGGSLKRIREEMPNTYIRYVRNLKIYADEVKPVFKDPVEFIPRPWQSVILDVLSKSPDDRSIHYVLDVTGGAGKSHLTRHLVDTHGAIVLSGRLADMAYLYDSEPIVVFDLARTQADNLKHLYQFAEELKNGIIVSTKYESKVKRFPSPHVIFFSNSAPIVEHFSAGRLVPYDVNEPDFFKGIVVPGSRYS